MISVNDLKPGLTIMLDNQVYQVISSEHHKPGKGQAVVRTRIRDVKTGKVFSKTFTAQVKVPRARVERRQVQYTYSQGDIHHFMDMDTYEDLEYPAETIASVIPWLKEGESVLIASYEGELLFMEPQQTVERRVIKTDPGLRGDTAQGGTKPAQIEGGVTITVPLFINEGDLLKVETATGAYMERVTS